MKVVKEQQNETTEKNYAEYGYEEGQKFLFPQELFSATIELIEVLAKQETNMGVELKGTLGDTFSQENTVKNFTSVIGLKAFALIENLNAVHTNNVDEGIAIHQDILNKPKINVLGD